MALAYKIKHVLDLDGGSEYIDTFLEKVKAVLSRENLEYFFFFIMVGVIFSYVPVAGLQKIAEYLELY